MAHLVYNSQFYAGLADIVARSARVCVPLIVDLLGPRSVVDIGCGQGDWLHAFEAAGVQDIFGVDGDYVRREELRIPAAAFRPWNLTQPLSLGRRFEVALSLEVGEHLPTAASPAYVAGLVDLAPAVVFSAALPGQGGVDHVNERWPWYWKELFARHGYVQLDPFRHVIWKNPDVAVFYQQNLFLYVAQAVHQPIIDRVGVPDDYTELTLVRTTILQELTGPNAAVRVLRRIANRIRRLAGGATQSRAAGRQ